MRSKRILLVDDIEMNLAIVQEMLRDWNIELVSVRNGEEAVQWTGGQKFDLILMDIQMPVMNGIEATSVIRKDLTNPNCKVPIIAISANANESERALYLEAGMNEVLAKPFTADALYSVIAGYLQIPVPETASLQSSDQQMAKGLHAEIDLTYLLRIGRNNRAFVGMMLQSFRDSASEITGEMELALEGKDWAKTAQLVHKLKFALNVIGAGNLGEEMKWIEANTRQPRPDTVRETEVRTLAFIDVIKELNQHAVNLINSGEWS
jgi:two-component system, sensor histidine kinase